MNGVLFLEKVFLTRRARSLSGVELFNLSLAADLSAAGCALTVPAHPAWAKAIRSQASAGPVEVLEASGGSGELAGSLLALARLRGRRFDCLLLGNVGNSLAPAIVGLRLRRAVRRIALIAHRQPKVFFLRALAGTSAAVLPVNRRIGAAFARAGHRVLKTSYGIARPDLFYPAEPEPAAPDGGAAFCVLGKLARPWKGADTAAAAFRRLPPAVRRRCRLHLAGYAHPPAFGEAGVLIHPLIPFNQVGAFLRQMDAMIVPSRDERGIMRETFSQAAVQGMLSGLPLIVSDLPVLREKVEGGGGLVFRTEDDLAAAMARLAGDPALRRTLGRQGRAAALERYVWNTRAFMAEVEAG